MRSQHAVRVARVPCEVLAQYHVTRHRRRQCTALPGRPTILLTVFIRDFAWLSDPVCAVILERDERETETGELTGPTSCSANTRVGVGLGARRRRGGAPGRARPRGGRGTGVAEFEKRVAVVSPWRVAVSLRERVRNETRREATRSVLLTTRCEKKCRHRTQNTHTHAHTATQVNTRIQLGPIDLLHRNLLHRITSARPCPPPAARGLSQRQAASPSRASWCPSPTPRCQCQGGTSWRRA